MGDVEDARRRGRRAGQWLGPAVAACSFAVACTALIVIAGRGQSPEVLAEKPASALATLKAKPATARTILATAKAALDQLEGKQITSASTRPSSTAPHPVAAKRMASKHGADPRHRAAAKAVDFKKKAGLAHAAALPPVSAHEVHKIMKTMIKAAAAKKLAKRAKESKTERMQDRILSAQNSLASLKLKKSKDFARYEKESEAVDHAKSEQLQSHDEYEEDVEREHTYKQRLHHLKQKLADHLTGAHARTDLNNFFEHLSKQAAASIPKRIREADARSTASAAHYKRVMEGRNHGARGRTGATSARAHAGPTVALKAVLPSNTLPKVNVWDASRKRDDVEAGAEKDLAAFSHAADEVMLKTEMAKQAAPHKAKTSSHTAH